MTVKSKRSVSFPVNKDGRARWVSYAWSFGELAKHAWRRKSQRCKEC